MASPHARSRIHRSHLRRLVVGILALTLLTGAVGTRPGHAQSIEEVPTAVFAVQDGLLVGPGALEVPLTTGFGAMRWDLDSIAGSADPSRTIRLELLDTRADDPDSVGPLEMVRGGDEAETPTDDEEVLLSNAPEGPVETNLEPGLVHEAVWRTDGAPGVAAVRLSWSEADGRLLETTIVIGLGRPAPPLGELVPTDDGRTAPVPPTVAGTAPSGVVPGAAAPAPAPEGSPGDASGPEAVAGTMRIAAVPSTLAAAQEPLGAQVVIDDGHVDMGPRLIDGDWRIQLKDDRSSPAVWRELSDVVLAAGDDALIEVPSGDAFSFLGAAGSPVYLLPQTQQAGIVWPGWNTQDPSVTSALEGPVTWKILGVDGPGAFSLFLTDSFGSPDVLFDSSDGFPQQLSVPGNVHVHGNWAFGEKGLYRVRVEMSANTNQGPKTDTRTLVFAIGDGVDPSPGFGAPTDPGGGGSGGGTSEPGGGAGGAGVGASGTGSSSGGAGSSSGGGSGSLPATGFDPTSLSLLGLALLGAGLVLVRRRRTARVPVVVATDT